MSPQRTSRVVFDGESGREGDNNSIATLPGFSADWQEKSPDRYRLIDPQIQTFESVPFVTIQSHAMRGEHTRHGSLECPFPS